MYAVRVVYDEENELAKETRSIERQPKYSSGFSGECHGARTFAAVSRASVFSSRNSRYIPRKRTADGILIGEGLVQSWFGFRPS